MNKAYVNLFDFQLGISIQIGNESYRLINGNPEGVLQMVKNYDVDELVLIGPNVITDRYEKAIKVDLMSKYNCENLKIIKMEG